MVVKKKSKVKTAKTDKAIARMATDQSSPHRKVSKNDGWRKHTGTSEKFQGIDVFAAVDPYKNSLRKEFRSAMNNPYVTEQVELLQLIQQVKVILQILYHVKKKRYHQTNKKPGVIQL